ncbi:MAG: dienelactone hydrolase family protein [Acidiferrobacterales bacterium]
MSAYDVRHGMIVYPEVQHGFFCDERNTYDPAASDHAWKRTIGMFKTELGLGKNGHHFADGNPENHPNVPVI